VVSKEIKSFSAVLFLDGYIFPKILKAGHQKDTVYSYVTSFIYNTQKVKTA
jgi:hypothetical protein